MQVEALIAILRTGKENLAQLVALAQAKQKAIIANNCQELQRISRQEMSLVAELNNWEERRVAITAGDSSLSSLISQVDDPDKGELLAKLQRDLIALTSQLMDLNQQNTELLRNAFAYLDFFWGLVGDAQPRTYSPHPTKEEKDTGRYVINQFA